MSLNTPAEVMAILEVPDEITDLTVQSFLDDASLLIEEDLAGKGLSDARLKAIEKYIAAHLAVLLIERGGLTSSKEGDAQDTYTSLSPLGNKAIGGFALTRFGQQAMIWDTSGTLRKMSSQSLPAQFRVVGGCE